MLIAYTIYTIQMKHSSLTWCSLRRSKPPEGIFTYFHRTPPILDARNCHVPSRQEKKRNNNTEIERNMVKSQTRDERHVVVVYIRVYTK